MLRISRTVEAAPGAAAQPQDSDDEEMERILRMEMVEVARQAQAPQELLELEIDLGRESSDSEDD